MNSELDLKEVLRLINAFIKKTNETNLFNAIDISYKYIFEREKLNILDPNRYTFLNPLISILVVSYNSGNDLLELFKSINNQTYKNKEVILVENGDKTSKHYLEILKCPSQYISSENIGFAAANNLAFNNSNGSYLCLINPDTYLKEEVLEHLLNGHLYDQSVGVTVPKIVFMNRFIEFEISSKEIFHLNLNELDDSLIYKKYFIRVGKKINELKEQKIQSVHNKIVISLPIDQSKALIKITKVFKEQSFCIKINERITSNHEIITLQDNKTFLDINLLP